MCAHMRVVVMCLLTHVCYVIFGLNSTLVTNLDDVVRHLFLPRWRGGAPGPVVAGKQDNKLTSRSLAGLPPAASLEPVMAMQAGVGRATAALFPHRTWKPGSSIFKESMLRHRGGRASSYALWACEST